MPVDTVDLGAAVQRLANRVYNLEMLITGPSVANEGLVNPSFDSIDLGPITIDTTSPAPTGLTLASGAFLDRIYIDASWTAPADPDRPPSGYWIEWAKKNADLTYQLPSNMNVSGTSVRIEPVDPLATYGVRVRALNKIGIMSTPIPAGGGYQDIVTGIDTTAPPAVTGVVVARGATTVVVKFTPMNSISGDPLYAPDVADGHGVYEVQIDTANTFNTANLRIVRTTAYVVGFNDVLASGNWYARVRAIDESGNLGAWSATAGPAAAGGVIDSMIVAGLDAAKITFGTMSGDRITANTLDVATIKTSNLTTQTITINGGQIVLNGTSTGVVINSQGITLYNAGAIKVQLNATSGTATFRGLVDASTITATTIQGGTITAADFYSGSGAQYVGIGPSIYGSSGIKLASGTAGETTGRIQAFSGASDGTGRPSIEWFSGYTNAYAASITLHGKSGSMYAEQDFVSDFYDFSVRGAGGYDYVRFHWPNLGGDPRIQSYYQVFDAFNTHTGWIMSQILLKGLATSSTIQIRDAGDNFYEPVVASAFNIGSKMEFKHQIHDADDALPKIVGTPIRHFRLKSDDDEDTTHPDFRNPSLVRVGPMYEEAPEHIRFGEDALDIGSMVGLLWKGEQELLERIERLESNAQR